MPIKTILCFLVTLTAKKIKQNKIKSGTVLRTVKAQKPSTLICKKWE